MLVVEDKEKLVDELRNILKGNAKKGAIPPLWDGHAGERIADILRGMSTN
jgi:UDP-N-acetylglucosamine 2-epimerase (non-hydrolysing)